jgi:adenylate cyclase
MKTTRNSPIDSDGIRKHRQAKIARPAPGLPPGKTPSGVAEKYQFTSHVKLDVEHIARRAVVFTDLQGSTKWLEEEGALAVFRALEDFFSILSTVFGTHRGEIVKRTGDGVMAVFESFADAATAVVASQQKLLSDKSDKVRPFLIQPMRVGISAGDVYKISHSELGNDYFGKVCAEASRVLDLCEGHHILVAAAALAQEHIGEDELKSRGILFTKPKQVYRKGLDEVGVCELMYRPFPTGVEGMPEEFINENGFIRPQAIAKGRPDITPFDYYENSTKAEKDVDQFLLESRRFEFLIIRGIIAGSSSPFNRFMKLLSERKFGGSKIEAVRVGILDPNDKHLREYYSTSRGLSAEVVRARIEECKKSVEDAKTKLERFRMEGKIASWEVFIYKHTPIWRLAITERGVFATPYGGESRTAENLVIFTDPTEHPFYEAFRRHLANIAEHCVVRRHKPTSRAVRKGP